MPLAISRKHIVWSIKCCQIITDYLRSPDGHDWLYISKIIKHRSKYKKQDAPDETPATFFKEGNPMMSIIAFLTWIFFTKANTGLFLHQMLLRNIWYETFLKQHLFSVFYSNPFQQWLTTVFHVMFVRTEEEETNLIQKHFLWQI